MEATLARSPIKKSYHSHYESIKRTFPDLDIQKLKERIYHRTHPEKPNRPLYARRIYTERSIFHSRREGKLFIPLKINEIDRDIELKNHLVETPSLKLSLAYSWDFQKGPKKQLVAKKTVLLNQSSRNDVNEIYYLQKLRNVPGVTKLLSYSYYHGKNAKKLVYFEQLQDADLLDLVKALDNGVFELSQMERLYLSYQVLRTLEDLHERQGIAYCDVKLENLLIDTNSLTVTLTDLETCRPRGFHETDENLGTPLYCPPEKINKMWRKKGEKLDLVGQDLWGAGCVIHALLGLDSPEWMIVLNKIQQCLEDIRKNGDEGSYAKKIQFLLKKYQQEIDAFYKLKRRFKKPKDPTIDEIGAYIVCRMWMKDPKKRMSAREAMDLLAPFIKGYIDNSDLTRRMSITDLPWATEELFASYAKRMESSKKRKVEREAYQGKDRLIHQIFVSEQKQRIYLPVKKKELPPPLLKTAKTYGMKKLSYAWMWEVGGRIELVAKKTLYNDGNESVIENEIRYLEMFEEVPTVVPLYDHCTYDTESLWTKKVLFEPLFQMDLFTFIQKEAKLNALSSPQTFFILDQILQAIEAMHDQGVAYLDLKPENILINDDLRVCLTDLATCRPANSRAYRNEAEGTLVMWSPEKLRFVFKQTRSPENIPQDAWSLGHIVQELFLIPDPAWKEILLKLENLLEQASNEECTSWRLNKKVSRLLMEFEEDLQEFFHGSGPFDHSASQDHHLKAAAALMQDFWAKNPEDRLTPKEARKRIAPLINDLP